MEQMRDIQARLDQAFLGKKQFGEKLRREWELNRGFILDALGMPLAIYREKTKDATNRCIQTSAHKILQIFIYKVVTEFWKQGINYDWLIADYHDEIDPIVDTCQIPLVKEIYRDTLRWLNEDILKGDIPLKAEPLIAYSLAEVKCENWHESDDDLIELLEEMNEI